MLLSLLNPFSAGAQPTDGSTALKLVESEGAILVDVRDPEELASGRAEGAINVPLSQAAMLADPDGTACDPALRRDRPVILYCISGARSRMAGKLFVKLGYEKVFDMGTLSDWQSAGGKVVR